MLNTLLHELRQAHLARILLKVDIVVVECELVDVDLGHAVADAALHDVFGEIVGAVEDNSRSPIYGFSDLL